MAKTGLHYEHPRLVSVEPQDCDRCCVRFRNRVPLCGPVPSPAVTVVTRNVELESHTLVLHFDLCF